jgi:2-polyprenyl-3-methyl-5-hydroxy-6-metoxy-1,4-benzoquinol methylase
MPAFPDHGSVLMGATAELSAASPDIDDIVRLGKAVGDRLRASILQVLNQDSYSVGELCNLFDVPQPALSHHLKILRQANLVARRREGNSLFYRRAALPSGSTALSVFEDLDRRAIEPDLAERIQHLHEQRNQRSAEFFARNTAEISARQAEISEPAAYADVVLEMIQQAVTEGLETGRALEVGPGGGLILTDLADVFDAVIGVDNSRAMLDAARAALRETRRIRLKHLNFMDLPGQRRYDAMVAAMVVHHQASPSAFFHKAASVLHPGGALVVAELCRHDQDWAADACGDQWLGFEPDEIDAWARHAGLTSVQSQYLAQKNGFRVQVHRFRSGAHKPSNSHSTQLDRRHD